MAGIESTNLPDTDLEMMWSFDKSALNWSEEYLQDIAKSAKDKSEILKNNKDWALLMHKRVFLKKCHSDIKKEPLEIIRKVKAPVLILRGRRDTVISPEHIKLLEESLKEGGNEDYEILYFNRFNHFFGKKIEDGIHRTHLSVDKKVADATVEWMFENIISPPVPEEKAVPPKEEEPLMPELEETAGPKASEDPDKEDAIIKKGVL